MQQPVLVGRDSRFPGHEGSGKIYTTCMENECLRLKLGVGPHTCFMHGCTNQSSIKMVCLVQLSPRTRVQSHPRWLLFKWRRKAKTLVFEISAHFKGAQVVKINQKPSVCQSSFKCTAHRLVLFEPVRYIKGLRSHTRVTFFTLKLTEQKNSSHKNNDKYAKVLWPGYHLCGFHSVPVATLPFKGNRQATDR